jgi:hypothetical protein
MNALAAAASSAPTTSSSSPPTTAPARALARSQQAPVHEIGDERGRDRSLFVSWFLFNAEFEPRCYAGWCARVA